MSKITKDGITVDHDRCKGCRICEDEAHAPNTFYVKRDNLAYIQDKPHDSSELIDRAIADCPKDAITRESS